MTLSNKEDTMERMNTFAAALVATVLVAALAACGGQAHQTLTKAQVVSQGGAICKRAEQQVNALPQLTTEHPFAKGTTAKEHRAARAFLVGYARALDGSRIGLAKLDAPSDGRALLEAYLAGIGQVAAKLRSAAKAPGPEVEAQVGDAFGLFDRVSSKTAAYGFPKGVCGSGSAS
jgi:hypothetical protein